MRREDLVLARGEPDSFSLLGVEDEWAARAHRHFPDDHDLLRARPLAVRSRCRWR